MQITEYDLLVLKAFEALRREISEAEQYTAEHYNSIIRKQQEEQAQKAAQAQAQAAAQAVIPEPKQPVETKSKGTK